MENGKVVTGLASEFAKIPDVCYWHNSVNACTTRKQTDGCPSVCPRYGNGAVVMECTNERCAFIGSVDGGLIPDKVCPKCGSKLVELKL